MKKENVQKEIMQKARITELVFILDRSGSMSGLESDTVGGFNSLLEKQRKEEGEAVVTTVLFDSEYELLHDRINIRGIAPITEKEYFVRGSTALLDAIGNTINKIGNVQKHTGEEMRADKVLFVIITDGMENASTEFSSSQIKKMVERQKERYGWEFLFLGANIDAVETASHYGIHKDRAVRYCADSVGTNLNFNEVSKTVSAVRECREVDANWKESIEQDYEERVVKKKN